MKLVFTRNKLPFSWLIRWGLKEPVSHMAFVFDEKLVFHSNFLGVHIQWFDRFKKENEIVFELPIRLHLRVEESVYQALIGQHDGRPYDWAAFAAFCYHGFMFRFFRKPIPAIARVNDKRAFICTELAYALPSKYVEALKGEDLALLSPFQVLKRLREVCK